MTWSSPWPLLWLWTLASIPAAGVAGGLAYALHGTMIDSPGGFFSLPLGAGATFVLGGGVGFTWGACLAIPHLLLLRLWVGLSRYFGDTDVTRGRILVGMLAWALPQAIAVGIAAGGGTFLGAWGVVAFGLWLPRATMRKLRPGVFGN